MDKIIGMLTRVFLGKEIAILLKLLLLVPKLVDSVEPKKESNGKYCMPMPEPNVGEFACEIFKLMPDTVRETATKEESKNCAYHLAKSYQYIKALFN